MRFLVSIISLLAVLIITGLLYNRCNNSNATTAGIEQVDKKPIGETAGEGLRKIVDDFMKGWTK